jgi:hypothetical protein
MFPNKPVVMNPEAFRYFNRFPLTVRARARTGIGNLPLHSELLFKINLIVDSVPRSIKADFIKGVLTIKIELRAGLDTS